MRKQQELSGLGLKNKSHGSSIVFLITIQLFVWVIDERLKPVFPYCKKELEFQLGYNEGKGEFFFFHFGNKNLIKDADALARMMPKNFSEHWTFIAEK